MTEETPVKIDYQGNSYKAKQEQVDTPKDEERQKAEPLAKGVKQKKPLGRKIAETFKGDDAGSIGSYVLFDVVIPAAKNMFVDAVIQGVERAMFGESSTTRRSGSFRSGASSSGPSKYTPYNKMSTEPSRNTPRTWSDRGRRAHDFDEIVLPNRGDAERVLDALAEKIDKFDVASVADLLDLVDVSSSYVDNKYGWTRQTFPGADIVLVRNGYLLDLPKPGPLD